MVKEKGRKIAAAEIKVIDWPHSALKLNSETKEKNRRSLNGYTRALNADFI